jgi:pimeloyl-ACP methyl ester carboxylesterase
MPTKPSIVFAHGLWADGSCYSKVIPALEADGHQVVSAQNSFDTLAGDVATVTRAPGRVTSPAILVGHSYAGTVITAAGTDDRVAGLVYIAALAPDENETSQSLQEQFPVTEVRADESTVKASAHALGYDPERSHRVGWSSPPGGRTTASTSDSSRPLSVRYAASTSLRSWSAEPITS